MEQKELNLEEMEKVSGGTQGSNSRPDTSCPSCKSNDIEFLGVDSSGRIYYFKCGCGLEFTVYI